MIQRIQTLWLFFAALAVSALYTLPVYQAFFNNGTAQFVLVRESYMLFIVSAFCVVFPLIAIFSFKNRGRQKWLVFLSILLNLAFIALIYTEVGKFTDQNPEMFQRGVYKPGAVLPIISIIFLIMAYFGILRDQDLIKKADRLR